MRRFIRNADVLLAEGRSPLRGSLIDIAEHALAAADPYAAVRARVSFSGDTLRVDEVNHQLHPDHRVYVVGAGKASYPIARAIEELLGDRIHAGIVIGKHGQEAALVRTDFRLASHPLPDANSIAGARAVSALLSTARPGDLVIACFTGGSSALFADPADGLSLEDKRATTQRLLTCGADIVEINRVRKHLSKVKGGRLAQALVPGVRLVNLTVSDVIGDALDYITDPTVPDTSTLEDARAVLDKYELWNRLPTAVTTYLRHARDSEETPDQAALAHLERQDVILVRSDAACHGAMARARALGFAPLLLSTCFEGESRELGRSFAAMAREAVATGHPLRPPCVLIGGGETVVTFGDEPSGAGGPNQEFATALALGIDGLDNVAALSLDSDGTDGPTAFAGALVDGASAAGARAAGVDLYVCLRTHDVTPALERIGDAILTGATGTNVNDLKLVLIA